MHTLLSLMIDIGGSNSNFFFHSLVYQQVDKFFLNIFTMVEEAMRSEVIGGDRCVYGRWAINVTSPHIASEIMGIGTLNRGVSIPFFLFLF